MKERKDKILHGSIVKTLFTLSWPIMLGNAFQTIYNLVDTYWVGKLGKYAVAAITPSWPIFFLFMSLAMGFTVAGVSLVSQYTGAQGEGKKDRAAGQVYSFMLISSVILGISGFFATNLVLNLMGVPPHVLPKAKDYLQTMFFGLPFMFTYFSFRALVRAYGDTITPMLLTGVTVFIDFVIDPFFILGWSFFPRLELQGAALATVIARFIATIIAVFLLFTGKMEIKLNLKDLIPRLKWIKKIVSIGVPSSLSRMGTAIGFVVLMSFVSRAGAIPLSAYGIGTRITRMINVLTWGITSSLAVMIGQNLGAEQQQRAGTIFKKTLVTLFAVTSIGAILIVLVRQPLYQIFISNTAIIREGTRFLSIFALSVPFFGIYRAAGAVFRGSGHTQHTLILSLIRLWGLRIFLSYLLYFVFHIGVIGLWIGNALGNVLGGIISLFWVYGVNWQEKVIEETAKKI